MMQEKKTNLKAFAQGEMVILQSKARKKGEEIKSESGLVLGIEQMGEIPLSGIIVSVGDDVPADKIKVNDRVLLPDASRSQNVPDPRIISGEMSAEDPKREIMITTHYKNICVVYK